MATDNNKPREDKNLINLQPGGERTPAEFSDESYIPFAQRVALADDKTRSRYNAAKNAFLGYVSRGGDKITVKLSEYGEEFFLAGILLGKIRLVRGYVRLFLALNPKKYPKQRYHHNDYSRVARYADCPTEITISNASCVKSAYSLIGEVMRRAGALPARGYIARDCSADFDSALSAQFDAFDYADMAAADKVISDSDIAEDEIAPPAEPIPQGSFYGSAQSGEQVAAGNSSVQFIPYGRPEGVQEENLAYGVGHSSAATGEEVQPPRHIRLPKRAKVVDGEGKKIGRVRSSVWYDGQGKNVGLFEKLEGAVYVTDGGMRRGFVDANDNVVTMSGDYRATLRRFPAALLIIIIIILAAVTAITAVLSSYFMTRSDGINYAPVLFVADEHGTNWEDEENLPVFYNNTFGTEKIAPGMTGSYAFTLENNNPDALEFSLTFSCINEYGIEIVYSLWRDGACIAGAADKLPAADISLDGMTIEEKSSSVFVLEWEWRHNDEVDSQAGVSGAFYTLNIQFTAAVAAS